jgi:hypothetical protein
VAWNIFSRYNHSFSHAGVLRERCLNFPQFDAEAANLDLVVNSTEKLDVTVT